MSTIKRPRSPHGSEGNTTPSKMRKMSQVETPQRDHIQITVELRSTSKAAENDPISPKSAEYYRKLMESFDHLQRDAGDETETLTDDNGDEKHDLPNADGIYGKREDELLASDTDSVDSENEDDECDEDDLNSEHDEFAEWKWLEHIDAFAIAGENQVAQCDAKLIRRSRMRNDFLNEMLEPSEKTSALVSDLFDRYGCLRQEYYQHEVKKGTGIWDRELDEGDMLLFESIVVGSSRHRQGIATKVVKAVLDETRRKSRHFFAFVQPGYVGGLYGVHVEERVKTATKIGKKFFQSLGFRRVGTSTWFAFADDNSHPSRSLATAQDIDAPDTRKPQQAMSDGMNLLMATLSDPLITGTQCVSEIEDTFRAMVAASSILSTDRKGNNILHIAAISRKTEAAAFIQSNLPQLANTRNIEGYTPAETLQNDMEMLRTTRALPTHTYVTSDRFEGFKQSDVTCLATLTGTDIFYPNELTDSDTGSISSTIKERLSKIPGRVIISNTLRLMYGC
ncbi:hypothetical protein G7Z17_g3974 [Cylindrodendrum hubeiense]|uniref:Uncharacterized protein n=1 Tax=Cylindrodendrum hubeiense TaxID=595255 RepID=A0A9P5HHQ6_9HYPO|nr:hypothetical protein G7Z17_g3974 [Cylindrodendrum hubeiense]